MPQSGPLGRFGTGVLETVHKEPSCASDETDFILWHARSADFSGWSLCLDRSFSYVRFWPSHTHGRPRSERLAAL
jgi:hypothetical protein